MGELHARRQGGNESGEEIQALEFWSFFTRVEQHLQSEADTQKWHSASDRVNKSCAHFLFVKRANQSSIMSHTGEQDSLRLRNELRRRSSLRFCAKTLQGALNGRHVARAVVNERH